MVVVIYIYIHIYIYMYIHREREREMFYLKGDRKNMSLLSLLSDLKVT